MKLISQGGSAVLLRRKTEIHRARRDCDGLICIEDEEGCEMARLTVDEVLLKWEPINDAAKDALGVARCKDDGKEYSFTGI